MSDFWRAHFEKFLLSTLFLIALGSFFWFACIWITSYFRERQHPYDRQSTLVPPSLR